jgi:hypothetical protein
MKEELSRHILSVADLEPSCLQGALPYMEETQTNDDTRNFQERDETPVELAWCWPLESQVDDSRCKGLAEVD